MGRPKLNQSFEERRLIYEARRKARRKAAHPPLICKSCGIEMPYRKQKKLCGSNETRSGCTYRRFLENKRAYTKALKSIRLKNHHPYPNTTYYTAIAKQYGDEFASKLASQRRSTDDMSLTNSNYFRKVYGVN